MPLFLCRWPNGDCSVVLAGTKEDAIGELLIEGFGEGTKEEVISPQTELGRDVKRRTDRPTILIDGLVRKRATKRLENFEGRGKPS